MGSETLSMAQAIQNLIEQRLTELHTAMPAEIVKFYPDTGLADVQPSLKRKFTDGTVEKLPQIPNVPIMFARGGGAAVDFEMEPGDPVTLIFSERSIDLYISKGGILDPQDPRKHALSDAFAYPGGYPKTKPIAEATIRTSYKKDGSVITKNAKGTFTFDKDGILTLDNDGLAVVFGNGTFSVTGSDGTDYIAQFLKVIDLIMSGTKVATSLGLQPFIPDPTYAAERAKLDQFEE